MARLASPLQNIKDHYTVVVVGSGYGGGIAASRLARAGQSVCVLERGKEFQPGEYPDTSVEFLSESQVHLPDGSTLGPRTGLYDFRVNQELNALVGCGLGGTSLINAGVALRPEDRVFDDPRWPKEIRELLKTTLADGYNRAEQMLGSTPYPADVPPVPKMLAQQKSAQAFGEDKFARLPINVTFQGWRQSSRRRAVGLQSVRRLYVRLQLPRQEYPDHELPARRQKSRRGDFLRSRRPLSGTERRIAGWCIISR